MSKFNTLMCAASAFAMLATDSAIAQVFEDEIIVTATRRAENIQDIPIAVTAIQPEQLEKQGVVNIQNLSVVAPSFSSSNAQTSSGTVVLRIRGVGTTSNNIGFESAVGVFVDGAYQSRPGVALGEFVDVERVEVLRGPQGTLFGRNTSAGALNVTNVKPQIGESGGFVNATYGNYDHMNLQGAVNIPLSDNIAARVSGAFRKRDGYVSIFDEGNKIGESNGIDQHMIRAQLGYEGDNGVEGRVIVDYSKSTAECCAAIEILQSPLETDRSFANVGLGTRAGMSGPIVALDPTDIDTAERAAERLIASSDQVPDPSSDQIGITGEIKIPVSDNADVVYIGSYREYDATEEYDSDFSSLDVFNVLDGSDLDINTMTHELRVQGDAMDGKLDWLVGAYYSEEDILQATKFELGEDYGELITGLFFNTIEGLTGNGLAFGTNILSVFAGGADTAGTRATNNYTQDSKSFSLFTHNVLDVTDDLSLTVGLRYSDESKTGGFNQTDSVNPVCNNVIAGIGSGAVPAAFAPNVFGTGCFAFTAPADLPTGLVAPTDPTFLPTPLSFNEKFEDDELIYTGKISYDLSPNASSYASFTHGYKSGGFNLDSTAAIGGGDPSFASEEVDAYELGLKTKLADGRVTFNAAAFHEEFTNFQVLEFTGAQFVTFNVPKAETTGIELEGTAQVSDALLLNGGLTLLDAEYPDDCAGDQTAINVTSLCGNTLTNAPKTVGIAGATYSGDIGSDYNFFLNGQMRYESDRRTSTQAVILASQAPNPFDTQESNVKINLRAGVGSEDDGWMLEAWATNVTNQVTRAVTFNTVLRSGSRSTFVQEPRMYGLTARKNF